MDTKDIVERLRNRPYIPETVNDADISVWRERMIEAANEIVRLRDQLALYESMGDSETSDDQLFIDSISEKFD